MVPSGLFVLQRAAMRGRTADVLILGGGLTGISAAAHLRRSWLLVEREARLGGTARSTLRDGYTFDQTGHWLHLRDPYTRGLVGELLGDRMARVARKAQIFSSGVLSRYPFQANLEGLPPAVIKECLLGFIAAWQRQEAGASRPVKSFHDFILDRFGEGIARHFMVPYNHKLWGVHPREITAEWCTRFVPVPSLEDVVGGAVGATPPEMGYNISFVYPREGGIETLTRALASRMDLGIGEVATGATVERIDVDAREAVVGGERVGYRAIVSTIPLPELLRRIPDLPDDLQADAAALRCTPVRYFDLAARRTPPADYHWIYVPEEKYPFYRVGVYSNAVPAMAPPGHAAYYVELADRGPRPTGSALAALTADVVRGLVAAGALHSVDDVAFAELHEIEHAYVVFDDRYYAATTRLRAWLEERGIFPRGRYGYWTYNGMEDCILAGREVASTIDARMAVTRPLD